jgi:hypothetical protein
MREAPGDLTRTRDRGAASLRAQRHFASGILATIRKEKMLRIRAGTEAHRFIGIWAVVVDRRVFVRSWSVMARGWYRTFLEEPRGAIQVVGERSRSAPWSRGVSVWRTQ